MTELRASRVLTPDGWRSVTATVADGRLVEVKTEPAGTDPDGTRVVPGLLDLQVNGGWGIDLASDPEGLWRLAARLPSTGVTAFLPTLVSSSPPTVDRALDVLAAGPPPGWHGAWPLGWHLEGPFLAPERRAVHAAAAIRPPDPDLLDGWLATGQVAMVTLAPELPGAAACIDLARAAGVVVSAGHSDATFDQAREAFARGVTAVTHVGNAMSGVHHREPGLVGAALTTPGVVVGVIADGHHLHPGMLALVDAAAGERVALVTDAIAAAGLPGGRHRLGETVVTTSSDQPPRDPDRRLAGSTLDLPRAISTWQSATGRSLADAVAAATVVPAVLLGRHDRGRIEEDAVADWCVLDDDGAVRTTVAGGRVVHDVGVVT